MLRDGWRLGWHALDWLLLTASTNFGGVLTLMVACILVVFEWLLGDVRGLRLRIVGGGILSSSLMVLMHLLSCLWCLIRICGLLRATHFSFFSCYEIHMNPVLWMLAVATEPWTLICLRNNSVSGRLMTLSSFILLRDNSSSRRGCTNSTNVEISLSTNIRLRIGWLTGLVVRLLR